MANLTVTYILWLFGGIFGLHHLYLNRPRHFFIWFVSWGGMVLGWLGEVSQIQAYVDEANRTDSYKVRVKQIIEETPKPDYNFVLLASSLMIGHQLSSVLISAVPAAYLHTMYGPYLAHVLAAIGSSIGVYLVANMGPINAPFCLPCLAAIATFPTAYFLSSYKPVYILVCVVVSAYVSNEYADWCTEEEEVQETLWDYGKTTVCLVGGLLIYGLLWGSNHYHNTTVSTLNGTQIPLRVAVSNMIETQPWEEAQDAMWDIIPCMQMYSWDVCHNQIIRVFTEISDPNRDRWAFEVLAFETSPTQKQISSRCRKLSSKWHPDRFRQASEEEKKDAEKQFVDVQKACGILNMVKVQRERRNTWSMSATEQSETVPVRLPVSGMEDELDDSEEDPEEDEEEEEDEDEDDLDMYEERENEQEVEDANEILEMFEHEDSQIEEDNLDKLETKDRPTRNSYECDTSASGKLNHEDVYHIDDKIDAEMPSEHSNQREHNKFTNTLRDKIESMNEECIEDNGGECINA